MWNQYYVSVLERIPSYRESKKESKEKQGPTLGVRFKEVSVKKELTVYLIEDPLAPPALISLSLHPLRLAPRESPQFTANGKRKLVPRDHFFPLLETKISSFISDLSIKIILSLFSNFRNFQPESHVCCKHSES